MGGESIELNYKKKKRKGGKEKSQKRKGAFPGKGMGGEDRGKRKKRGTGPEHQLKNCKDNENPWERGGENGGKFGPRKWGERTLEWGKKNT